MKRNFIISGFIISLCIGAGLFIYLNENHELAPPLESNSEIAELVHMNIEEIEEVSSNSFLIVAVVGNTSEQDVFINEGHSFEYFDGNNWITIPTDVNASNRQYIAAGETEFIGYNFDIPRGASDLFRLRITVSLIDNSNNDKSHDLVVEFNLNE